MSQTSSINPPPNSTNKIFVTGGTGLLGSHLLATLVKQGKHIKALYRSEIPNVSFKEKVEWVKGDILDVIALNEWMQDVEEVYHCAAVVSFNPKHVKSMYKINVEGTANVVNAAINNNVERLCYVSSVAALGRIRKGEVVNETMNWTEETSNSEYGKSKNLAEMEVWRGVGEGLKAVIVNPSIILGAGDWNTGSTKLFKSVYNEFPWYTEGVSGFVDVDDVVRAMIDLTNAGISGQRFILNGANCNYRQLFIDMAKCFGKKPPHKNVTRFIAAVVWRLEALKAMFTGDDPLITKETAQTAQATVHYDASKINEFLPSFQFTPIQQTIESICNQLKAKYDLK
jgi:dihydroflavonol-4-reductase